MALALRLVKTNGWWAIGMILMAAPALARAPAADLATSAGNRVDDSTADSTAEPSAERSTMREAVVEQAAIEKKAAKETIVRKQRSKSVRRAQSLRPGQTPEDALEAAAGVALTRSGGPLAPADVSYRGLSGARLSSSLGSLLLNSPATGAIDIGRLPFFAIRQVTPLAVGPRGNALAFELRSPAVRQVMGRVGAGSFQTARADVAAGAPLREESATPGSLFAAASAASTRGDFTFDLVNGLGTVVDTGRQRVNNDQLRASALADVRSHALHLGATQTQLSTTLLLTSHRGGVPGFSTAPPPFVYRAAEDNVGVALGAKTRMASAFAAVDVQARTTRRAVGTDGAPDLSELVSVGGDARLALGVSPLALTLGDMPAAASGESWVRGLGATVLGADFSRGGAAVGGRGSLDFFDNRALLSASVDVGWLTDAGLTATTHSALELRLPLGLSVGTSAGFHRRAPTLDELYAPRGLVVGNPNLEPETIADAEVYATFALGRAVSFRAAAFGGRLFDAIVFVSQNAFEIGPTNTGGAWRAGADGHVVVTPHRLFSMRLTAQGLLTSLDDTGAPLPRFPPFLAQTQVRVGERFGAALWGTMRHRQGAPTTLFGTLATRPYTFFDLRTRIPVGPHLAMTAKIDNIFDVKTAQDANLLPLPGRTLFFSVEVSG